MWRALIILKCSLLIVTTPFALSDELAWDWRTALLKEKGSDTSEASLRALLADDSKPPARLEEIFKQLGAEAFDEREEAQLELLDGGVETYQWLRKRAKSSDPEIRQRVLKTLGILSSTHRKNREDALQHAITSLLKEGDKRRADTGGVFYEWFGEENPKLQDRYHLLRLKNSVKRTSQITGGCVVFSGTGGADGDQRLILEAKTWPGRENFGDEFEVSAKLGGEPKSAGAWHLGISIGKVRVLYHPGLQGGNFRIETVAENRHLQGTSAEMGFLPKGNPMERMTIKVQRAPQGSVSLFITIIQGGEQPVRFERTITVKAEDIGPLNQISLDRSGRTGGEAYFSDFLVKLKDQ